MQHAFRPSTLVPRGFAVDGVVSDESGVAITVHSTSCGSACPECGSVSEQVHSRYRRCLADLPMAGRPVRIVVMARPFRCAVVLCRRRIFAERFGRDVLAPWTGVRVSLLKFMNDIPALSECLQHKDPPGIYGALLSHLPKPNLIARSRAALGSETT